MLRTISRVRTILLPGSRKRMARLSLSCAMVMEAIPMSEVMWVPVWQAR